MPSTRQTIRIRWPIRSLSKSGKATFPATTTHIEVLCVDKEADLHLNITLEYRNIELLKHNVTPLVLCVVLK